MSALPRIEGRVLVCGDVMTDIVVRPEGSLVIGSDRRAAITIVQGGSAANQAAWLAALDVPVALFARVGAGDLEATRARFATSGVVPLLSGDPVRESGRLVALIDPTGERSFLTDRGANLGLCLADLPADWLDGTGLLIVSGYTFFAEGPRSAMRAMMAAARARGVPVIVDAASAGFLAEFGTDPFIAAAEGADIILANQDEAALLTGRIDPEDQLAALLKRFPMVILKRGAKGSLAGRRNTRPVHAPGIAAERVDSTGAGDAFLAGFVRRWRTGGSIGECLAEGNRHGAEAVTRVGGRPR